MDYSPKTREQKLVEAIYPFFGDLAHTANEDEYALRVCRHLRALKERAILDSNIADFIDIWNSEHPEENSLTNDELLWALESLDDHMCLQLKQMELDMVAACSTRAKLRVINGGLHANPDRPYVGFDNLTVTF